MTSSQNAGALLSAAEHVAALAGDQAARADETRRLDPDLMKAVLDAGFARHFVPLQHGGAGGTFAELTEALLRVGSSCAASSWSASIVASLGRMAGFLPAEGRAEVWQDGPDAVVVGSLAPLGRARAVPGGWRLTGTWPSISVVDFSDWALVRGVVPDGKGQALRVFVVPRRAYEIQDTWDNAGMRATGSNTLVVDDVFVPETRSFEGDDLFQGRPRSSSATCHTVPLQAVNGLSFAAPALGAARGALAVWSDYAMAKFGSAPREPGGPGISRGFYASVLARAAGEIDAAYLLLDRAGRVADRGAAVTPLEAARNTRDCALAVEGSVTAVNRIFGAAGTSGHSTASSLQRFWRDVNAAATHIGLQFEPAAIAYATALAARASDTE
ncbi:hydrolase [Streptomyces laculatispora]|uniref:Hydrolase n=1 Tax=Streptomyces laculatispora TaxID=887464 RepID=A0ABY9I1E9_9ACTN|nr:hydrolase [Streptomyces laculatispora]WLQ40109.1 hydrolase [Streptomyces laculatispora]